LTLTGTLLADDPSASQAIIGEAGQQRGYRTGDALASGGARVHTIRADHVILERGGQLEALRPRPWDAGGAAAAPELASVARAPEPPAIRSPAPPVAEQPVAAAPKLLAPGETPVGNVIRFTAYREGSVVGLRASPGRDSQTFRDLGLRAGDVITGVNGTSLGGRPSGAALVQALQTSQLVKVTLVRDGIPQVVTIPAAAFGRRLARR
jgi:general secretion pathway protein C